MVNCPINETTESLIVIIDKLDRVGRFLHRLDKNYISEVIFEVCKDCFKMPSVPQGAFAVHKLKEKRQHIAVCKVDNCNDEKTGRFDLKHNFSKLGPVKYNEKMMNSIWGRYNRNSPHNFKKNNAADGAQVGLQQPIAVAQDLSIIKGTSPNQQGRFISAAVAAAGFGSVGHNLSQEAQKEKENHHAEHHHGAEHHYATEHHHGEVEYGENGVLGPHGHTHPHGHHGHYHRGKHDHSHYEQIWNFSVI